MIARKRPLRFERYLKSGSGGAVQGRLSLIDELVLHCAAPTVEMKTLRVLPALLWLSGLLASPADGQTISPARVLQRYQQVVWQDRDGLPANGVSAIVRTPDGYLWLSTAEGVVRFDGVRFTTFDSTNTPEIKSNNLQALLVERAPRRSPRSFRTHESSS